MIEFILGFCTGAWIVLMIAGYLWDTHIDKQKGKDTNEKSD